MKKILSMLLVFMLIIVGCSKSKDSGAPSGKLEKEVTIQFWHPFTGEIEKELTRLTTEFNNSNDKVTVELIYQGSYNDLESKLLVSKKSSSLPTISVAYSTWDGLKDSFTDLEDFEDIDGSTLDWDMFVESFLDEVDDDDMIFGVPFNKSTEVLYYNKAIFEQVGITTNPTSYEELFEISKSIYDATSTPGVGFDSLSGYLASSLSANDLSWYDDGKFQFTDANVAEDVKLYQDAVNAGYARTAGEDMYLSGPFGSAKVAMYAGSTAGKKFVDSAVNGAFEWGAMSYPNKTAVQQGTNIVVYNTATNDEKLGAWEFINFLTQEQNVIDFAIATGYLPTTTAALNSSQYQDYIKTDEVAKAAYDQTAKMTAGDPVDGGAGQIYRSMQVAMSSILDNNVDVMTGLEDLSKEAKSIHERN